MKFLLPILTLLILLSACGGDNPAGVQIEYRTNTIVVNHYYTNTVPAPITAGWAVIRVVNNTGYWLEHVLYPDVNYNPSLEASYITDYSGHLYGVMYAQIVPGLTAYKNLVLPTTYSTLTNTLTWGRWNTANGKYEAGATLIMSTSKIHIDIANNQDVTITLNSF